MTGMALGVGKKKERNVQQVRLMFLYLGKPQIRVADLLALNHLSLYLAVKLWSLVE